MNKLFIALISILFISNSIKSQVVINEYCSTTTTFFDEDNDNSDWVELYNASSEDVNLEGWHLSDKEDNLALWTFPNVSLPAKSFLLVFCSDKNKTIVSETSYLHTNFKISADGEIIYLSDSENNIIHQTECIAIPANMSRGLSPDGSETWAYYPNPTPKTANTTQAYETTDAFAVKFSKVGGLYTSSFEVALSSESESDIYYTLDCKEPNSKSTLYKGPITISETTVIRAITAEGEKLSCSPSTQTYIFANSLKWNSRNEKNGTVKSQKSLTHKDAFDLPVFALTTAPDNLWDSEIGIYVEGPNAQYQDPHYGANYHQDWERPIHVEYYENGAQMIDQEAGVKIAGAYSRMNAQKSLALHARSAYGKNSFDCKFFDNLDIESFKSVVLRNSGNDFGSTHFRDAMITGLISDNNIDIQAYKPTIVFINGEFWGIMNLREKLNEDYIENHNPSYSADKVDILENNAVINEGSNEDYLALLDFIKKNDLANDENYNYVKTQIDIDEYLEYIVTQMYCKNDDWPDNNVKFWKSQDNGSKWRWFLYDTDRGYGIWDYGGWGTRDYQFDMLAYCLATTNSNNHQEWPNVLLRNLVKNSNFKRDLINRFADRMNKEFLPNNVNSFIDKLKNNISTEMTYHNLRWNVDMNSWNGRIDAMKNYATNRPQYMREHLRNNLNAGNDVTLTVNVNNAEFGYIQVNSLTIKEGFPWQGKYFSNNEISVRAIARPGYKFVGWQEDNDKNPERRVKLNATTSYTAVFEISDNKYNSVAINEINYKSSDEHDSKDWVELYNTTASDIDISRWVLTDDSMDDAFTMPVGTIIPAYGYIVVCESRDKIMKKKCWPNLTNAIADFQFGLGKSDQVRLFDDEGSLIDCVEYNCKGEWPEEPNGNGYTLSLIDPFVDNSTPSAWGVSTSFGTPGTENDNFAPSNEDLIEKSAISNVECDENNLFAQCSPNPFTSKFNITWIQPQAGNINIQLISIDGKILSQIENNWYDSGMHSFDVDNLSLQSGLYFVKVSDAKGESVVLKVMKR